MIRRHRTVDMSMREEWKDEFRALSNQIHVANRLGADVPEEKQSRLRQLFGYLRSQSGE